MRLTRQPWVVHWGTHQQEYAKALQSYADDYGYTLRSFNRDDGMFKAADEVKYASMVICWNGMQSNGPLVTELARKRGIPIVFFEYGIPSGGLGQRDTFSIDLSGFCGRSFINGPLSWVSDDDMERMLLERAALHAKNPPRDEGYVLLPSQVHNDTQVMYHSCFQTMTQVLEVVAEQFPNQRIRLRSHPNSGGNLKPFKAMSLPPNVELVSGHTRSVEEDIAGASAVVGLTSTVLYQAAIAGKRVLALGDHPLRTHIGDQDRCAAAALAMVLPRESTRMSRIVERFNIRPLGCKPLS